MKSDNFVRMNTWKSRPKTCREFIVYSSIITHEPLVCINLLKDVRTRIDQFRIRIRSNILSSYPRFKLAP